MLLRFGECLLDTDSRELQRGGQPVHLSPKGFDLLVELLAKRPRVVTKAHLHNLLWPRTYVSHTSLARLINEVRTAIADDARQPRFIRTVSRVGYAFSRSAVEEVPDAAGAPAAVHGFELVWDEREIPLHPGENVLGRSAPAVVCIPSSKVSRAHARIVVSHEKAVLEDLGSKNGTYLWGMRIGGPVELNDGDQIGVGPVVLVVKAPLLSGSTDTATLGSDRSRRR